MTFYDDYFINNNKRRFHSYLSDIKKIFGGRVQKLSINAGFTCPNRDGTKGKGGCTFCLNEAFNPSYCRKYESITKQIEEGIKFHKWRYNKATKYIAYFQTYSNTYASIEYLERVYSEALSYPDVVGIVIGTRPDCIDTEKINLLKKISTSKYVSVEYGIETCYNDTLMRINRCHDFETSVNAVVQTAAAGINTAAHLIIGLPGDDKDRILNMAKVISKLPLKSIKLHQLQIFKGTAMGNEYLQNPLAFTLYTLNEYIEIVIDFIELLNPNIAIERISGEAPPRYLLNQGWGLIRSDEVLTLFEKRLKERNTYQGKKW
ncbi:MAG TPA: TIGR01212 family radical SAM protein [Bacteroidales bacterium]|nr:TIGR01212 family radical SAM protein [Bacteroidales bacterium]